MMHCVGLAFGLCLIESVILRDPAILVLLHAKF